jgi:hypothetical protein
MYESPRPGDTQLKQYKETKRVTQDTFPTNPSNPHQETETVPATHKVVIATDEDDIDQVLEWFRQAMKKGYDVVYHQSTPPQTEKRMLMVAKGFDSSNILRVLLDEEKLP